MAIKNSLCPATPFPTVSSHCLKLRRFAKEAPLPFRHCFAQHKHNQFSYGKAIFSWGTAPNPECKA